ncbi:Protein kinase superfamily protein [Prunus dulcis]|uniref:non-specific serine/threonine protein kinase n=3 Tax=Prunus dulcis TaxID=3755 RepID=A0A4Y1QYL7_PRUDU|nr:Protein kinase superfamily protein [Prunus dulcis]
MQQCVDELVNDIGNLNLECSTTAAFDTDTAISVKTTSSHISSASKPHARPRDPCWDAIQGKKFNGTGISLDDLGLVRRLGCGDIGSVYLVELEGSDGCMFAAK